MPRFLVGDELGNIKALHYSPESSSEDNKTEVKSLYQRKSQLGPSAVQSLAIASRPDGHAFSAAAFSDGTAFASSWKEDDTFEVISEWKETRMSSDSRYVGLALSEKAVYSCTSNGALRMTPISYETEDTPAVSHCSSLPTRLYDWKLASNHDTFAYGGDEVDLSVWNTELAFQPRPENSNTSVAASNKRKRSDALFPGETWRAKNVPHDHLGLRQPIRITSLTYISSTGSGHHLLTGTQLGDVRRYDTRAARRPIADWKGIGKVGGVKVITKGFSEHEAFVSDHGYNLFSVDLRNGRVVYSYKGFSGAVTSMCPSSTVLASTALDRFARIHSVFPPPAKEGGQQEEKGEVLEKVYLKTVPTVVLWDQADAPRQTTGVNSVEENDDDVWDSMLHAEDGEGKTTKRLRKT